MTCSVALGQFGLKVSRLLVDWRTGEISFKGDTFYLLISWIPSFGRMGPFLSAEGLISCWRIAPLVGNR